MPSLLEKAPLYAVFAALGFAFAENSLYLFSLVRSESAVSTYVSTWFSRSLFSVVVHTLCSVVAVMPFFRALRRGDVGLAATYATISGLLFAIAVHAAFDVSVSYGRNGVVFLYLVFAYVFVTRAFNSETANGRA
jgi:RsiW-degrading membrane proteinase PrsW (M82 family)